MRRLRYALLIGILLAIVPLAAQISNTDKPRIFPDATAAELIRIYEFGQTLGNRPNVFSKVGDSITVSASFFQGYGEQGAVYYLGDYEYLRPVVEYYRVMTARTSNSFANLSLAAGVGWTAGHALDPQYSDTTQCYPGELPLLCEYRLTKPVAALIMFGTNDVGYIDANVYRANLERIVLLTEERGIIPILSTIPNRPDMPQKVIQFNTIVAEIANKYTLPLWDFYAVTAALPNTGLMWDNVHPSSPPGRRTEVILFTPENLQYGYTMRNLSGLYILNSIWLQLGLSPV